MTDSAVLRRFAWCFLGCAKLPELNLNFLQNDFVDDIEKELTQPTDMRLFAIASAFNRGYSVDKIWKMTSIDKWFLTRLMHIHNMEKAVS